MASKKKVNVGSIVKGKDGSSDYLKVRVDGKGGSVTLTDGMTLSLQSPKEELAQAKKAFEAGKLTEEVYNSIKERIEKIPDYVRFSVFFLKDV